VGESRAASAVADAVTTTMGLGAMAEPVRIGLLGCGTVGSHVIRLIAEHAVDLEARVGRPLEVVGVAVRDLTKPRPGVPAELLTDDVDAVLAARPDLVVELVGGVEPAREWLLRAIAGGASVVTANKALLAEHGPELAAAATAAGVDLQFEAAVAGAIPLLRPLRESLVGDRVQRVLGIVNGTTNYVLDRMDSAGLEFADALAEAQALGYAEADPTADVEGFDAAAKAAILARLAFHTEVSVADVHREGITGVTAHDVASAAALGAVVKLLAVAERLPSGAVNTRVVPTMVPRSHPLASVRDAFNAVFVEAEAAGELMFYGRGAGGAPTASAVLGDVVTAARNRVQGVVGVGESSYAGLPVAPLRDVPSRVHVVLDVDDRPGVLAAVAGVFAAHSVSIESVRQQVGDADDAELVIVTHVAPDGALTDTVAALGASDVVRSVVSVLRVLGDA
jgi:homoserine dehydrogenase